MDSRIGMSNQGISGYVTYITHLTTSSGLAVKVAHTHLIYSENLMFLRGCFRMRESNVKSYGSQSMMNIEDLDIGLEGKGRENR